MLWRFKYEINIIFVSLLVLALMAGINSISAQDVNAKINDTEADYSFTMAVPYNAGTGYHWEISPESHGVEVISINFVEDYPGTLGSSGTGYFNFHVIDNDDYYVKLVLISPKGDIVSETDSNS